MCRGADNDGADRSPNQGLANGAAPSPTAGAQEVAFRFPSITQSRVVSPTSAILTLPLNLGMLWC